ncbi:anti-sigma-F factor Fin family protein [Virgibacillus sp. NKC19-3]|uniref:anti-sigma-F factor Fin family protein n=1 Tax=Virgibacillus saliphilus TaxID=2831674 RepID=UPI001C9A6F57|nr:anti-sigma-F factor Fin family protein [Virgibacillus sp. NKC19-3]MBY7141610.1 anti-sigma-F factor Fin family protein [Virgibacillus sp. NKC19-3]
MAIVYKCRHCGNVIGKLEEKVVDTSLLGFDQLTTKEKREMIHYADNGDVHIQAICENCEETLGHHPHYHELDFFIQ